MLISLHEQFPVRITDWLLSAILFSWGLNVLFLAPEVWNLPIYSGLATIGGVLHLSQHAWGCVGLAVGLGRLVALFVNGAIRRSPHLRAIGALIGVLVWLQITLALVVSNSAGIEVAIIPWLAMADLFNVYRAAMDARISDIKARDRRRTMVARGAQSA